MSDFRAILLVGNLTEGFEAYGPFLTRDAATQYAWDSGIQANEKNWVMELKAVRAATPGEEPHILMAGDPSEGWVPLGPFADFDEADDWADKNVGGETWVMPLLNPETGKCGPSPALTT